MKLNLEQIKEVTQGAVRVTEDDRGFHFSRFTEEQEQVYRKKPSLYSKIGSTAGIQMEFDTDGDVLCLKGSVSESTTRTYFSFDIYEDGVLLGHVKNFSENEDFTKDPKKQCPLGDFEGTFVLKGGNKRVRVVFPWSVKTDIEELTVEHASYIRPVRKNKTIIMYGDSITQGYDALYPSNTYAVRTAKALDAELYNKGIGGEVFFPELAEAREELHPDYITVAYGTNDWSKSEVEDFTSRCKAFFALLSEHYPDTKIFALSPIWRKDYQEPKYFKAFSEIERIIAEVCRPLPNVRCLSGWDFVAPDEIYFGDRRLHPNDEGFRQYADNLVKKMRDFL